MKREDFEIESDWMTVEGRYTFVATAFEKDTHRICAVAQLQVGMRQQDFIAHSGEEAVKAIEIGVFDTCERAALDLPDLPPSGVPRSA